MIVDHAYDHDLVNADDSGHAAGRRGLRRGAKGLEVRQVQEALVALGYSTTIDGKFGPATAQAVKSFQASSGLTADGVVGPATLSALSAAVNGT